MKQALEAYHQDMLESGKYSSLNAVQLWDDNHSTLTSLTNKFIPSKLSNLHWVNQKLKRIARQRDRVFQKHRKSGKPADRKSPSNFRINPTLTIFLMWPQMILPPNPIQKNSSVFKHSKQDSASVAPLHKHYSVHQDDPTKAAILNE